MWYLDFYTSKHICTNQDRFADLQPKTYEYLTAGGDIIQLDQVETVIFSLKNSSKLIFPNVTYTPNFNSNLISLGQLQENSIAYYDYPESMILKQGRKQIGLATRRKNLFVLDTCQSVIGKAILVKGIDRPIYHISKNP